MQQQYQCPNCGGTVAFGVGFCDNCGTQLNWPTQQQMQPPPQYNQPPYQQQQWNYGYQQQRPKQQTSVGLLVIILIVGLILVFIGGNFLCNPTY